MSNWTYGNPQGKVSLYIFNPFRDMRFKELRGEYVMPLTDFQKQEVVEQLWILYQLGDKGVRPSKAFKQSRLQGKLSLSRQEMPDDQA